MKKEYREENAKYGVDEVARKAKMDKSMADYVLGSNKEEMDKMDEDEPNPYFGDTNIDKVSFDKSRGDNNFADAYIYDF